MSSKHPGKTETLLRVIADFFFRNSAYQETVEQHLYKELKENNNEEFYIQRKYSKRKIKMVFRQQKMKKIITSRTALQEMLREILQAKEK